MNEFDKLYESIIEEKLDIMYFDGIKVPIHVFKVGDDYGGEPATKEQVAYRKEAKARFAAFKTFLKTLKKSTFSNSKTVDGKWARSIQPAFEATSGTDLKKLQEIAKGNLGLGQIREIIGKQHGYSAYYDTGNSIYEIVVKLAGGKIRK